MKSKINLAIAACFLIAATVAIKSVASKLPASRSDDLSYQTIDLGSDVIRPAQKTDRIPELQSVEHPKDEHKALKVPHDLIANSVAIEDCLVETTELTSILPHESIDDSVSIDQEDQDLIDDLFAIDMQTPSADDGSTTPHIVPHVKRNESQLAPAELDHPVQSNTNPESMQIQNTNDVGQTIDQWEEHLSSNVAVEPPVEEVFAVAELPTPGGKLPESVVLRIRKHLEYGRQLARKGITFSARDEFTQALSLIAQQWDYQANTNAYSGALSDGFTALNEAEDFVIDSGTNSYGVDTAQTIASHQSKIIPIDDANSISTVDALQYYLQFSSKKIAKACGHSNLASEVLYSLAKMHLAVSKTDADKDHFEQYRSMVLFRASYAADPTNSRTANELAVQLATNGELQIAKQLLIGSLRSNPSPVAWRNLAQIHRRLGEVALASKADFEFASMQNNAPVGLAGNVNWVTPQNFNEMPAPMIEQVVSRGPMGPSTTQTQQAQLPFGQPAPNQAPHQASNPQLTKHPSNWQTWPNAENRIADKPKLLDRIKKIF